MNVSEKPILSNTDQKTQKTLEILRVKQLWMVVYDDMSINIRQVNKIDNIPPPKYKKTTFASRGHAVKLAKNLNERFSTDKFNVVSVSGDTHGL